MGFAGKQIGERGSEVVEIRESDTGPMKASKMLCNLSSLCEVTPTTRDKACLDRCRYEPCLYPNHNLRIESWWRCAKTTTVFGAFGRWTGRESDAESAQCD